jgi:FMN phosphatase YigB (HAD superfamily)
MQTRGTDHLERSPRNLKAVVFDVDGTLYRLRELKRAVQIHFCAGTANARWRLGACTER